MELSRYHESVFGKAQADYNNSAGFTSYAPKPIPRNIELNPSAQKFLSEADIALGRLDGLAILIPDPTLLISPFIVKEALSSSRIEGTKASFADMYIDLNDDVQEVNRYICATEYAIKRLVDYPLRNVSSKKHTLSL